MSRFILISCAAVLTLTALSPGTYAQRTCGTPLKYEQLATENPALYQQMRERRQKDFADAAAATTAGANRKTSGAQYPIPVVFHFILTQAQYGYIGGDAEIMRRVYTQMDALNADFNRKNADSTLIPTAFKNRYANVNIQFGLAKATSANTLAPGIEVKVLPAGSNPVYSANNEAYTAKEATAIGLKAWDVTKYLNVWVVDVTLSGSKILGLTTPPSSIGYNAGGHVITADDLGVVLNYGAVGVKDQPTQYYIANIDKGRTLTHEMGHYFELDHIWGDDGGKCPGQSGGQDDFINDTPPQAGEAYCTNGNCPTFPKTDACSPNSPGIMFMNYMDYVDDRAMQMFTPDQAAKMQFHIQPGQDSYPLTQNPGFTNLGVANLAEIAFSVYPNPASDVLHIELSGNEKLLSVDLINMTGQTLSHTLATGSRHYNISVGHMPRGMYFVKCHFVSGTLTRKIVLQ